MLQINLSDPPVASNETTRELNRRVILNLIRERQPVSRADLARLSSLQRSTVSLIIEELIEDQWVVEGAMGRLPRGRRPKFLLLNAKRQVLCVDIRPTRTFLGLSDINGVFSFQESIATDPDPERAIRNLAALIHSLQKQRGKASPFEGIGISLPGRLDYATQRLVFAPNLKWAGVNLKTPIERATGLEVALENAANACALTHLWFSTPPVNRNFVVVTVSEGIGAGIVADGRLVRGAHGMAGEFGHFSLDPDGPTCGCGRKGCWETLASNQAAIRYYCEHHRQRPAAEFKTVLRLAQQGDSAALQAMTRMADQLARGVCLITSGLDPQAIVFVGEFTEAWDLFEPLLAQALARGSVSQNLPMMAQTEGELARLRGSVALVLHKHFGMLLV